MNGTTGKERVSRRKGDYGGTAPHLLDGTGTLAPTSIDCAGVRMPRRAPLRGGRTSAGDICHLRWN